MTVATKYPKFAFGYLTELLGLPVCCGLAGVKEGTRERERESRQKGHTSADVGGREEAREYEYARATAKGYCHTPLL